MVQRCVRCADGGLCPLGIGCEPTPEFAAQVRAAAATVEAFSRFMGYRNPQNVAWSPMDLHREINVLEANQ